MKLVNERAEELVDLGYLTRRQFLLGLLSEDGHMPNTDYYLEKSYPL